MINEGFTATYEFTIGTSCVCDSRTGHSNFKVSLGEGACTVHPVIVKVMGLS